LITAVCFIERLSVEVTALASGGSISEQPEMEERKNQVLTNSISFASG
jgi:hypothetical protein